MSIDPYDDLSRHVCYLNLKDPAFQQYCDLKDNLNKLEAENTLLIKQNKDYEILCNMIVELEDMDPDSEEFGELGLEILDKAEVKLGLVDRVRAQELQAQEVSE